MVATADQLELEFDSSLVGFNHGIVAIDLGRSMVVGWGPSIAVKVGTDQVMAG